MWQDIQAMTKSTPQACNSGTRLPDKLNNLYAQFEALNNTPARKTPCSPGDEVLCLDTADVRKTIQS